MRPSLRSPRLALPGTQRRPPLRGGLCHALTEGNDEKAHVAQPVGGLAGQRLDEEAEDGAQVALAAHRCHLHRPRHGGVTVAAGSEGSGGQGHIRGPRPAQRKPPPKL